MSDPAYETLLSAIAAERLVIFTGAGLSIPAPSCVPSAASLAQMCARAYEEDTGATLGPTLLADIEAQARFFHGRGQLLSYLLGKLIPKAVFAGEPNDGHFAVADFLLCHAIDLSITTNIDILVERAADQLGCREFLSAVRGSDAGIPRAHKPLLKIHGCYRYGPEHTLWCHEQLVDPEWKNRLTDTGQWLSGQLAQRDVVFIGYWTDWAYLNEVLDGILAAETPLSVTLVDPATSAELVAKAPVLWNWAHRDGITFAHVQASGTDFLKELRRRFSIALLKRIASTGKDAYQDATTMPVPAFPSFDSVTVEELYDLRRDWSGVGRMEVTPRRSAEVSDEILGRVFFELVALGGHFDRSTLKVGKKRVRLVNGAGRMLYRLQIDIGGTAPYDDPDITVCAGAVEDGGAATHVIRPRRSSTVVRPGTTGIWCNEQSLLVNL
jgi:NAD-dependent SIR2 family protein deacetylase